MNEKEFREELESKIFDFIFRFAYIDEFTNAIDGPANAAKIVTDHILSPGCLRLIAEKFEVAGILDCPYCDNSGFTLEATHEGELIQEQCQWCHETSNSKFNMSRPGIIKVKEEMKG